MKEQQPLNLDECKEPGKLEMSKEVVITISGMGTLAFFAFAFFFTSLYTLFTGLVYAIIKTQKNEKMEVKYLWSAFSAFY
ncbi:MAG: hypothetical protein K8R17_06820 [Methanosarcinales archaeon]|nr:hypothetical protein [Methanosarcinales archaeon]